jgi:hypothetical protein
MDIFNSLSQEQKDAIYNEMQSQNLIISADEVQLESDIWSPFDDLDAKQFVSIRLPNNIEEFKHMITTLIDDDTKYIMSDDNKVKVYSHIGHNFWLCFYERKSYSSCYNKVVWSFELFGINIPDKFKRHGITTWILSLLELKAKQHQPRIKQMAVRGVTNPIMAEICKQAGYSSSPTNRLIYCKKI